MHSPFPWRTHDQLPASVFDGDGKRIVDPWVPPEGWLPIETAPKDRVPIDVWCRNGERVPNAQWMGNAWREWGMNGFESMEWVKLEYEPTHWMPLPAPPSDAPTPLDPETAADNAELIAAIPQMVAVLEHIAKEDTLWASSSHYKMSEILGTSDSGNVLVRGQYGKLAAAVLASIGRTL